MWFLISLIGSIAAGAVDTMNINSKARAALPEQQRRINQRKAIETEHEERLTEMCERWKRQDEQRKAGCK